MSALTFPKARYEAGVVGFDNGSFAYLQPDGGWGFSNSGLVTSDGEALLIDTLFDFPHTRAMLDGFRGATDAKIRTLVNTHHNGDHCYGNALVEGAEIIATESATQAMGHEKPEMLAQLMKAAPSMGLTGEYFVHCFGHFDFAGVTPKMPDTTFSGHFSKIVGSKRVDLIEVGPAHTGGDAIAYVPDDKTVFTGDILFIEGHPIVWAGPVSNWIAACEMIEAMDAEIIVPGHGPITDKKGVARLREYLSYIRGEARARFDAGMGALEAARDISFADFSNWGDSERIAVNTATLYREFGATDTPSDAATLFGWMAQMENEKRKTSVTLIVYEHPLSPYAQKVKIALDEKGIAYETRMPTAIGSGQPDTAFLKSNPRGEVPSLIDGDVAIFDSTIILEYIEDKWPSPPLLPPTPVERAGARTIEDVMDTSFEPINWGMGEIKWFKRASGERARTLEARAHAQARGIYDWLSRHLGSADWFGGSTFGWADVCVIPYLNGARGNGIGPDANTPLGRWLTRANERPSVQKAAQAAAAVVANMVQVDEAVKSGLFKREYRDHRLEWMIRSGGLDVVLEGIEKDNIRFSNEMR